MGDYKRFFILVAVLIIGHFSIHYYADRDVSEVKETNKERTFKDYQLIANVLHMEVQISVRQNNTEEGTLNAFLVPTLATLDLVDRWEEVYRLNNDIPYPTEAIEQNDWMAISNFFFANQVTINDIHPDLTDYIYAGSKSVNLSMEELAGVE
jgi:hypothetical protein